MMITRARPRFLEHALDQAEEREAQQTAEARFKHLEIQRTWVASQRRSRVQKKLAAVDTAIAGHATEIASLEEELSSLDLVLR